MSLINKQKKQFCINGTANHPTVNLAEVFVELCIHRVDISEVCLGFSCELLLY